MNIIHNIALHSSNSLLSPWWEIPSEELRLSPTPTSRNSAEFPGNEPAMGDEEFMAPSFGDDIALNYNSSLAVSGADGSGGYSDNLSKNSLPTLMPHDMADFDEPALAAVSDGMFLQNSAELTYSEPTSTLGSTLTHMSGGPGPMSVPLSPGPDMMEPSSSLLPSNLPEGDADDTSRTYSTTSPMGSGPTETVPSEETTPAASPVRVAVSKPRAVAARRGRKKKDPNAPASVSSAYAFFFKEIQGSVKAKNPNIKFGEVSKIVAHMWENLGDEEKVVYKNRNEEDKARFEVEMAEYRAKQALNPPLEEDEPKVSIKTIPFAKRDMPKRGSAVKAQMKLVSGNHGQVSVQLQNRLQPPVSEEDEEPSEETHGAMDAKTGLFTDLPAPEENPITEHPCIRQDCDNFAVQNSEWEDEYCSNECAVNHCKAVFSRWIMNQSHKIEG
eukprot:snap_masked-scaffold1523_size37540-processed-gene-0.10 protein:Tk02356 transcript:snap_masked-scaffold1523_size37540-processed-gene-0.10-mRNA-1 annotation:"tox high mobility group box family member 4"